MKGMLLIARLAWRDMLSEKVMALCLIVGLAATAAPLLVIAGLRAGLVEGLRASLLEDPKIREVSNASNRDFDSAWLAMLARRPEVAFVSPRTRTLAASVLLVPHGRAQDGRRVELLPSRAGDPLLAPAEMPASPYGIVLSAPAAAALHVQAGDGLDMHIARLGDGAALEVLPVRVAAVAPQRSTTHDTAFVALRLAQTVEVFREARLSWPDAWARAGQPAHVWAGFRLYVRRLEDVPAEDAALRSAGVDVVSRAGDVSDLLSFDRRMTLLFRLTACMGVAGFVASLAAGLWANVERKRLSLATMRFIGVPFLSGFPLFQAQVLALGGIATALFGAMVVGRMINHQFAQVLPAGHPLCIIDGRLCALACALTIAGAFVASAAAAFRASRIDPWEGVSTP